MKNSINTLLISILLLTNVSNGLGQIYSNNFTNSNYGNGNYTALYNSTIDTNENEISMVQQHITAINVDAIKLHDTAMVSDTGISTMNKLDTENNWVDIHAENLEGDHKIHWTIQKEKDIDYFVIEISVNGKDFTEVGNIKGNENNAAPNQFMYTHKEATDPLSYYRVKQVDLAGKTTYSKMIQINTNNTASISSILVYPNPVNTNADIAINFNQNSTYILNITDGEGKMVVTQNGNASKGTNTVPLNMDGQKSGIYYIRITGANGLSQVSKFIKE